MTLSRKKQISLIEMPYYLCESRCVRNAFLCGVDKFTGQSYEHRQYWVEERLSFLSTVFTIDVCAFGVTKSQTHVVLKVNQRKAMRLSDKSVALRWHKLHKGSLLTHKLTQGRTLNPADKFAVKTALEMYRKRLFDISWFMRELREPIARKANQEDRCTGHFWESRFKSQVLLHDCELSTCMVNLGLNTIQV